MRLRRRGVLPLLAILFLAPACQQLPPGSQTVSAPAPKPLNGILHRALERDEVEQAARLADENTDAENGSARFVSGFLKDIGAGIALDHDKALVAVQQAAERGHTQACLYLAWKYSTGFGLAKPDQVLAADWRTRAAATHLGAGDVPNRWMTSTNDGCVPNFHRAFLWMLESSRAGNAIAQANLADAYLAAEWTTPDAEQHLYWLRRSAAGKNASSLERLAIYYDNGLFVPKDRSAAAVFRRAAADAGLADAQYALAEQFAAGEVGERNPAEAMKWYRLAAAQGHIDALLRLVQFLRDGAPGIPCDFSEAMRLAKRGAELGNAEAMAHVADLYNRGDGVPRDFAKSAEYYRQAADKGSTRAMTMLGWIYLKGECGAPNYSEARRWFEQAANRDDTRAKRELGLMFRDGLSGEKLPGKAFEWLERAARDGDGTAQNEMGRMLRWGIGIEADPEEAAEWYRLAAENGDLWGHANLGECYLKGIGMPKNPKLALEHLIIAARKLDSTSLTLDIAGVFFESEPRERPELLRTIRACVEEPDLMSAEGCLPEACLRVFEHTSMGATTDAEASALFQRLIAARRIQSSLVIAWHSYTGFRMPYNLAVVRARLDEALIPYPIDSVRMRAIIDSLAGEDSSLRDAARATLHRLAKEGDPESAFALAERAMTGLGEEIDIEAARKYHGLVASRGDPAKNPLLNFDHWRKSYPEISTPSSGEIVALVEQAERKKSGLHDHQPVPVYRPQPAYPYELRRSGLEGNVTVEFIVDSTGQPRNVRATESTHPLFSAAAVSSVQRWRFAPGRKNDKPVNTRLLQPINFSLNPADNSAAPGSNPPK